MLEPSEEHINDELNPSSSNERKTTELIKDKLSTFWQVTKDTTKAAVEISKEKATQAIEYTKSEEFKESVRALPVTTKQTFLNTIQATKELSNKNCKISM